MSAVLPGPAATQLAAARLHAAQLQPYLATALFALVPVSAPGLATFAVDAAWRLYADPARLDPGSAQHWTVPQLAAVLIHEVGHLLRGHAERGVALGAQPGGWNLATDAAINADLVAGGLDLPGDPVLPATLGEPPGRLAEEYYAALSPQQQRAAPADCGSGAHGRPRVWELAPPGPGVPVAGVDRGEAVLLREQVARAVREAARAGTVAGGWVRWAGSGRPAQVDWRRELRRAVRRGMRPVAGAVDYSYARPSRRAAASPGVVLAGLVRPVPQVAVLIDTSASMDRAALAQALAETRAVARAVGVRDVAVLTVDTVVQQATRSGQLLRAGAGLRGGGGTDLRVGLAAVGRLRPRPDVAVVLTDGDTPWPARPPAGVRVVVALLAGPRPVPPFARRVVVAAA